MDKVSAITSILEREAREVVPVQGCKGCRRFQKPGLHIYLRLHMEQHWREQDQELEEEEGKRKPATTSITTWKVKGGRLQLAPKVVQKKKVVMEEENSCSECDMAFETTAVLSTHMKEIHEDSDLELSQSPAVA